ncbi:hypothetical protein ACRAVF_18955 [Bradyrhizobium oligotrophicum S58]
MPRFSASYLEQIAKKWQQAFAEAHGKTAPAVTWSDGWFTIENDRRPKYRRKQLERMTEVLRAGFDD